MLNRSPKLVLPAILFLLCAAPAPAQDAERTTYTVEQTPSGYLVVTETVLIHAPVSAVWDAYTTVEGYQSWAAPVAEIDLRPGGVLRTSYDEKTGLEGDAVNTLRIVNFVPQRLLTLQAEINDNWPDVLLEDAENLYNVIMFEEVDANTTRIVSYGLGFTDSPELREMMGFFEQANAGLYAGLIEYLEG